MSKAYTIAQARDQLSQVVHEAEGGEPVALTRRGRPVAVVLAFEAYRRLAERRPSVWEALMDLRQSPAFQEADLDPDEIFAGTQDRSMPRDFSW